MQINDIHPNIEAVYYDEKFIQMIESHMFLLRMTGKVTATPVESFQKIKYEGDYFGLLENLRVEKKYHLIVTRFNGYTNSSDYSGAGDTVLIPELSTVELLKSIYLTKK